ncbi:MAG: response regulator, partial [Methanobacterium sp.]|nr:response regulator [Methanobacterium sp.]
MYNILVLEDDRIQLKTLSEIIKESGDMYQVYETTNATEAFKIAEQKMIDLF